jgi:protoporphyrinogen/coproporphyrinogen III oxidase
VARRDGGGVRAVVVGGGIAGLAAARRLEQVLPAAEVVLVERDFRLGGKIATERVDGFVVEQAPDSFLTRKARGVGLCEEVGLGDQLVGRRPEHERSFVRRGRELYPLPTGLTGMIPTDLDALEQSALLSPEGRARLAAEPDVPVAPSGGDESIASFATRRLGPEAYSAVVEPLMTGIYGGDGELLSLEATFPQLRVLELEHGSVLRGLAAQPERADDLPPFLSLRDGMDGLAAAVVNGLERARIVTGVGVTRIGRSAGGHVVELDDGSRIEADAVVAALPAFVVAELVAGLDAELAAAHAEIPYASSVVVTFGYRAGDVGEPLDGYGYVVPRTEGTDVLACTWTSQKWAGRAPEGAHLVRVYAGRYGGRDLTAETDADLLALARSELSLLGLDSEPVLARVHRFALGMPQYTLGHGARIARIEAALAETPRLAVAGAAYRGVGIPDCIASGEQAAESVARSLVPALR